jgi:hypothetical protein
MSCRVICISRSLGAGGEEIGRMVAKELAFRYADEEIIIKAAEKAGVSPETVAQAEHTPSLITRILESMARTPPTAEGWSGAAILPSNTTLDYGSLIEKVVRETANGRPTVAASPTAVPRQKPSPRRTRCPSSGWVPISKCVDSR